MLGKRGLSVAVLVLALAATAATVRAGTIAKGEMRSVAAPSVGFADGGTSIPFKVTGPGILVVTFSMSPYLQRDNAMSADPVLRYDREGWQTVKSEAWYDGRPQSAAGGNPRPDGSVRNYQSRVEYRIPARTFSGTFRLIEPKKCNLNDCAGRQAMATVTAEFVPDAQIGPAAAPATPPTPPTATPPGRPGEFEIGIDRPGSDLNCLAPVPTAGTCEALCNRERACVAFTWVKAGHIMHPPFSGQPICCLKARVPAPQPNACCVSGLK